MISHSDISKKSDSELLDIFRNQIDYREDVVAWVTGEIARRGLTTENLSFLTPDDQVQHEEDWYVSISNGWRLIRWALTGAVLVMFSIGMFLQSFREREPLFFMSVSMLAGVAGAVLILLALRSYRRQKSLLESRKWRQMDHPPKM